MGILILGQMNNMWFSRRPKMLYGEIKIFCPNKIMGISNQNGKVKVYVNDNKPKNKNNIFNFKIKKWDLNDN